MNWKVKPWVRPLKTIMEIPKPGNQQWMVSGICFYGHATNALLPSIYFLAPVSIQYPHPSTLEKLMSGNLKCRWFLKVSIVVTLFVCINSPAISWAGELEDAQKAVRQNPNDAVAHYSLGAAYAALGQYQDAIAPYKKATRIRPDYAGPRYDLGLVYGLLGRYQEAIASYKKATRIRPDYAVAHFRLGGVYYELGRYQEATASYKEVLRIDPNYANVHLNLGLVSSKLGRYQEAIASYKKAIHIKPGHADTYYALGNAYNNLGQNQEAITSYKKAIHIKPGHADTYFGLGIAYNNLGRYQEAITSYKKAIRSKPDYVDAHLNLGAVYHDLKQYQNAIASYKEAIRINPNDTEAYQELGYIYFGEGKINKALTIIKKADQIVPNDYFTRQILGLIYWELDKPKNALKVWEQTLDSNPELPEYRAWLFSNIAEVYEKLERYDKAIESSKKALEIDYNDVLANYILGLSYDAKGNGLKAIPHMLVAKKQLKVVIKKDLTTSKWGKRNYQKYLANTSRKLRTFYKKYKFKPEDFGEPPIINTPINPPQTAQVEEKNPSEEQLPQSSTGSGFFVSKMGHVITNAHVVHNCKKSNHR